MVEAKSIAKCESGVIVYESFLLVTCPKRFGGIPEPPQQVANAPSLHFPYVERGSHDYATGKALYARVGERSGMTPDRVLG